MQISTANGVLTLEAKWLVPKEAIPADIAKDPKSCLIVTVELREHAIAHAARVLRENGATPAQVKVGLSTSTTQPSSAQKFGSAKRTMTRTKFVRPTVPSRPTQLYFVKVRPLARVGMDPGLPLERLGYF